MESSTDWSRAEALRKAGEFAQAGKAFHLMWNERHHPGAGWRYAYCLRKAGYPDLALQAIEKVAHRYPEDRWVQMERHWSLYAARLKPAQERDDPDAVVQAARDMVAAGATELALQMAIFAAVGAEKAKGHWAEVARWCELLDPEGLSDKAQAGPNGRSLPSPLERYYFARLKALVETRRWEDALSVAEAACAKFRANLEFVRWKAHSVAGVGDAGAAVALLQPVVRDRRSRWYHLADLARFQWEAGQAEQAWDTGVNAMRLPAEEHARVGLLALLATVAESLGRPDEAADLLAWCLALRREQGWPIPQALVELKERLGPGADWDAPAAAHRRSCRAFLAPAGGSRGPEPAGGPAPGGSEPPPLPPAGAEGRYHGRLLGVQEGRPFAFLRIPEGQQIFVMAAELPENAQDGAEVTFRVERSFDRKKNRASWRGKDLRYAVRATRE